MLRPHVSPSVAALMLVLHSVRAQSAFPPTFQRGIVFASGEWSHPSFPYDSPGAAASLAALAATGASHVRLLVTGFVDNAHNATRVYSIPPPSALATETVAQLSSAVAAAHALGLAVVLCPVLDPNWDILPQGSRSSDSPVSTWRGTIGSGFTSQGEWDAFFSSFRAWAWPYLAAAAHARVATIQVSSELNYAFMQQEPLWRALIADIRALPFAGAVSIAVDTSVAVSLPWLDALDVVGVDVYAGLGAELPLGTPPTVDALVASYAAIVLPHLEPLFARNVSVVISETGFQSRPNCHVRPSGTKLLDPDDDSAWLLVVDTACQANAYEALMRFLSSEPRIGGVFLWLWRSDPTTGGTYNGDFTPHGKPSEVVLRRWYGNYTCPADGAFGATFSGADGPLYLGDLRDALCDGSAELLSARRNLHDALGGQPTPAQRAKAQAAIVDATVSRPYSTAATRHPRTRRTFNGWCLGTPDEWSSPFYRLGSEGSLASLDDMVTSTGADSVEIIAQWFFANVTDTELYPITDAASPLRTSTDEELAVFVAAARARHLKTIFTLMLDPDWLLPAQAGCRDHTLPGCYWRGQIGALWPDDCTAGSAWATWHENYRVATLHYAQLAQAWGMDALLLSHELYNPSTHCPALWTRLLTDVRAVFTGAVSSVLASSPADVAAQAPWAKDLSFLGVDCYFKPPIPPNSVPSVPWADTPLSVLLEAQAALMPSLAALSHALGDKPIVCTEIGGPSRPWAYTTWGGAFLLDAEDCSVWDQCVSITALQLDYEMWLQTYYAQPWFDGFLFWHWRADPTSGGMSSDGLTVQGKPPVQAVIKAYWGTP